MLRGKCYDQKRVNRQAFNKENMIHAKYSQIHRKPSSTSYVKESIPIFWVIDIRLELVL